MRKYDHMDYASAIRWCTSINGVLPVPTSEEENDFLYQLGSTWLGVQTDNMSTVHWTNWKNGEPNGDGIYVHLVKEFDGQWNDINLEGGWLFETGTTCYTRVTGN